MSSTGGGPLRFAEFGTTPRYNIKAVVQATGISPSTLRAWERRYRMMQPHRSASGYRLYSDRDVAVIRWLKKQVDAGMAISQAVAWLEADKQQSEKQQSEEPPSGAPATEGQSLATQAGASGRAVGDAPRSFAVLREEMLLALLDYDDAAAERVLSEAFSIYPIEAIGEELVRPVLVEIGERWHRQELSVVMEHYASSFLLQRMTSLLRAARSPSDGPVIWVGCAPNELHEGGAVLLAIYLRRAGYAVRYLGQDLPVEDIVKEAMRERPWMILLSASTADGAEGVQAIAAAMSALADPPLIGYGGSIFQNNEKLKERIAGLWMGENAQQATRRVATLLEQ